MPRSRRVRLSGWGGFPSADCDVYRPERHRELGALLSDGKSPSLLSRGLGRSYGDAAVNGGGAVLLHERLNRMLSFDTATGVLTGEAGVSLDEILATFVPRGYFLPVSPGTRFVTLGGAIAANIHGKNHHRDGAFCQFVQSFRLLTAAAEELTCSRDENADLFWATLGGMGLTGVINQASLRLRPVASAYIAVDYLKAANLDEALDQFSRGDQQYQYSVAWIDCLAKGKSLGRSVLIRGNHANPDELPSRYRAAALQPKPKRKKQMPIYMPAGLLNSFSVSVFNALFYRWHGNGRKVVDYDAFFFPLDNVLHWNRMYGRRGFAQYQAVFPHETARSGLVGLLERLSASRRASFLAVLKSMGPADEGLLSFPLPGLTLALDLPNSPGLVPFLHELDHIVLEHGGRVYLAKDSCLEPAAFARMYPKLPEFLEVKSRIDPQQRFNSSLARRLGITSQA